MYVTYIALDHLFIHESILTQKSELLEKHVRKLQYVVREVAVETKDRDDESLMKELEDKYDILL